MVTGASSGLGREIALQLAGVHGANVIVVARRLERLESLKAEIESKHGVRVQCIAADLTLCDDVERVFRDATREHDVYAAVLNAGVTHFGEHLDLSWSGFQALLAELLLRINADPSMSAEKIELDRETTEHLHSLGYGE